MSVAFDASKKAKWYAKRHRELDPGIEAIYYLPENADDREIRLLEVNRLIAEILQPEPVDFGVGIDSDDEHKLLVLDVTPAQWRSIRSEETPLPAGWSLAGSRKL